MERKLLRDDQWELIRDILPGKSSDPGATAKDNRLFIEAILWITRTGAPWRDLPIELGNWHTTYTRFSRWSQKGTWQKILDTATKHPDLEAFSSTAPSFVYISTAQERLKKRRTGHRSISWRTDNQNSCGCRCPGKSPALDFDRRSNS